jgi:hypothetical protein
MKAWYLNRLKTMSFPELVYRTNQFFQKKAEQYFSLGRPRFSGCLSVRKNLLNAENLPPGLLPQSIDIFGKEFDFAEGDIDWHKDIFSGQCFPLTFSKNISIRNNINLSAKNVWEINRLQFLPRLAINFRITGDDLYLNRFVEVLSSWIDCNPYLIGINWYSNIEVNIRLINWVLSWEILNVEELTAGNEEFKIFVERKWMPAIYMHCMYSFRNPSKFSSANNHLISEYAGLYAASSLWKFSESVKWLKYSKKGLEKEIALQHSSGINKEEAAEYIQFITDFFLLSYIIGENTKDPFSDQYKEHLHKIFCYIFHLLDCKGNFAKYGDEDDGKCFIVDADRKFNNFRSLLTSGSIIFSDPEFKSKSNGFDSKNMFLFGEQGKKIFESVAESSPADKSQFYPDEGHFILKKKEGKKEIYFHFDAAPLGYLSIAAHGHADALSFILHIDGQPVFVDSGTYVYHTSREWREYFIGTLAHNTIRINYKDQAVNGGPTLWVEHFKTKIIESRTDEDFDLIIATHNGYKDDGAQHTREVMFDKIKNEIHISDQINVGNHREAELEIPFHLSPEISINQKSLNSFIIGNDKMRDMEFYVDDKLNPSIVRGEVSPQILGWYSESFTKKEPTNVIYCKTKINCPTIFKFLIKIK